MSDAPPVAIKPQWECSNTDSSGSSSGIGNSNGSSCSSASSSSSSSSRSSNTAQRLSLLQLSNSETAPLIKYKKDVKTWTIVKLTLLSNESVLNKSLAERALMEVLKNLDKSLVENIIWKFPDIKIKCIHFMSFRLW
ncbi:hypothetical protein HZH66_003399 [Vespula vulgaris]|uniref:Uncharacterized protein n=1 Tax=Vespula vulgaris TaxID=7454 RepID=A0A834NEH8_VESVU|nr:hypothetical protein HZH66_003399 [Vespula vulgaris]